MKGAALWDYLTGSSEHLSWTKKTTTNNDDWRITAFDDEEYGINPFDYDTEEKYESAVLDAEIDSITAFNRLIL